MNGPNRLAIGRLLTAVVLVAVMAGIAPTVTVFENFENPSLPTWFTVNSNIGFEGNNFGLSATGNVNASTSEAGGTFAGRTTAASYFADVNGFGGPYGLTDQLSATGFFKITNDTGFDGGIEIGFFNPSGTWFNVRDAYAESMGIKIIDGKRFVFGLGANGSGADAPNTLALNVTYKFDMSYDPVGGGAGTGLLTGKVFLADGTTPVGSTHTVTIATAATNWAINAFGMTPQGTPGPATTGADLFVDNLTYEGTIIPEPSSLGLLAAGLLGLLASRRRTRN